MARESARFRRVTPVHGELDASKHENALDGHGAGKLRRPAAAVAGRAAVYGGSERRVGPGAGADAHARSGRDAGTGGQSRDPRGARTLGGGAPSDNPAL